MNEENRFHMVAPPTLKKSVYTIFATPLGLVCLLPYVLLSAYCWTTCLELGRLALNATQTLIQGVWWAFFFSFSVRHLHENRIFDFYTLSVLPAHFLPELVIMLHGGHRSWLLRNRLIINERLLYVEIKQQELSIS